MILTCPDCATRYSARDDAIGPNGRMVRCSNCKATWFVTHDADTLELLDNQQDELIETGGQDLDPEAEVEAPRGFGDDVKPAMGAHVHMRDKADQKRRNQRLAGVSMVWLVTLGLLGTGFGLAYAFRQNIVDRTPAAATLYGALGISVKASGLDFENPKTKNILIDGEPVLVVNGYVRNLSDEVQDLPMVELSLHSGSGEQLVEWLVELDQTQLPPKDRIEYISQYPNPPLEATTLKYKFVDHADSVAAVGTPIRMN